MWLRISVSDPGTDGPLLEPGPFVLRECRLKEADVIGGSLTPPLVGSQGPQVLGVSDAAVLVRVRAAEPLRTAPWRPAPRGPRPSADLPLVAPASTQAPEGRGRT